MVGGDTNGGKDNIKGSLGVCSRDESQAPIDKNRLITDLL